MKNFGLIGKTLKHSFSKKYFTEKWKKEGVSEYQYQLYELETIEEFPGLIENHKELCGLNVTIPYKQDVIAYLDELDQSAERIGAVNVIKFIDDQLIGYNSDYYGFKASLEQWMGASAIQNTGALVLGTGGASKAVYAALEDLGIPFTKVSRTLKAGVMSYEEVKAESLVLLNELIINTTPLGMYPNIDDYPDIDYDLIGANHYLYDLVYNPEVTAFMQKGLERGAKAKHGLDMLHLQAEKAWEIWQQ